MTISAPNYRDMTWDADENRWTDAKRVIGDRRVTLGPTASQQWLDAPEHLAMVLSRYRAAAALIGGAETVIEFGCGEGIGAGILGRGRYYLGLDTDHDAITQARRTGTDGHDFVDADALARGDRWNFEAVVALDVIEHIPADREDAFLRAAVRALARHDHGVCVIGTPSKHAEHLASPQSKAGHINLYTPDRLKALMGRYFHATQMLYMQDTSIHLGHPQMAHYILAVGIGPRRG